MAVSATIRIVTVDRLPLVHAGVRQLLSPFPDISVVGEAFDLVGLQEQLDRLEAAIVMLDIDDLGAEWLTAVQALVRDTPATRFVAFTLTATPERVSLALRAGIHGYLLKQIEPLSLAQALRSVAGGQQVLAPEATAALLYLERYRRPHDDFLSQREREVLALLVAGMSNQAIATCLCVSPATVKFHCSNLFSKLGVRTRGEAIALAFAHNLVPRMKPAGESPLLARLEALPGSRLRRA